MKTGSPGFMGVRLKQAREIRGFTNTLFANQVGVTPAAISQYEKGVQTPRPEILSKIATTLQLPTHFFFHSVHDVERSTLFYRSLSSATKAARTRASWKFSWLHELVTYLRQFVQFPRVNFPDFELPADLSRITTRQIEELAQATRRYWSLGNAPISNVVGLLENNGAIIVRDDLGAETLDALSTYIHSEGTPYIILGTGKGVAARSRFDASHELGHIILHRHVDPARFGIASDFKLMETQAHRFAGAFLLPEPAFLEDFYAPKLDLLLALKPKWKVSIAMMLMRGTHLGLMEEEQKRQRIWMNYSRRGWRTEEPLDDELEVEQPRLLRRSIELLLNQKVQSRDAILGNVPFSAHDIEQLACLPVGCLSDTPPSVQVLDISTRNRPSNRGLPGRPGNVVSFTKPPKPK